MRIAIPVEENRGVDSPVCEHFGRAPYFAVVEIGEGGVSVEVRENPLLEHTEGALPELLKSWGVDKIAASRMGQKAQLFFKQFGVDVVLGASGTAKDVLRELGLEV